ncbi:hypothetical protein V6N12_014434 [Hibiscus sabdariffa]|uniref:Uncharacterized protein n=1 Tax=Hibiscus sabdariffa TaxID=183260 RepID=A0ABR2DK55_9ROSI
MPPSLRAMRPEPSLKPHSPTLGLDRAAHIHGTVNPTQRTEPKSNHPNAPTRVTSRRYPTRRASYASIIYLNSLNVNCTSDVGFVSNCC